MAKASNEYNVADAGIIIEELTTIEDVKEFIKGDTRKGVLAAAEAKIAGFAPPVGAGKKKDEKPQIDPRLDKIQQQIMAHEYHTINIIKDKDEPDYAPVNCSGTRKSGGERREFELRLKVKRGEDVENVPREAVMVLYGAVATAYREVPKGGAQGGKRLVPYQVRRFPLQIKESYDTLKG